MSKLWMKSILAFGLAIMCVSGLFATGSQERTVTVWSWMNPQGQTPREVAFKQILENFAKAHPDIKVVVEPVNWQEIQTKWRASVETGSPPDVVWLLKAVKDRANFLLDLDKNVLNEMAKADVDDLYVLNTLESTLGTGTNYVFPLWQTPGSIIYYRKDLMAKAGITTPLRTWDQFLDAAERLTQDTNGDGKVDIYGFGDSFGEKSALATVFTYALAGLQDGFFDMKTRTAMFNTDAAARAAGIPVELAKRGAMPADAYANDLETNLQQFAQGRFAMVQAPAHRYGGIKGTLSWDKEQLGIMPWPTFDGKGMGPAFLSYFWEVGISKNGPNTRDAAIFMRFLMNKESSEIWLTTGQQVPNRKSLLSHPFLGKPENEVLDLSLKIITNRAIVAEPPGINSQAVPEAIGNAIIQMMQKRMVDKDLLQEANRRINATQ
jgi:multiple sugar transport system substrate-binding protein